MTASYHSMFSLCCEQLVTALNSPPNINWTQVKIVCERITDTVYNNQTYSAVLDFENLAPVDEAWWINGLFPTILTIMTILLNSISVIVFIDAGNRSPTNALLATISTVDLLTGLTQGPLTFYVYLLQGYKYLPTPFWCYEYNYFQNMVPASLHSAAILLNMGVSIQRCVGVRNVRRLKCVCTYKGTVTIVVLSFFLSVCVHAIYLVTFHVEEVPVLSKRMLATGDLRTVQSCRIFPRDFDAYVTVYSVYLWCRIVLLQVLPAFVLVVCNVSLILVSCRTFRYRRQLIGSMGVLTSTNPAFVPDSLDTDRTLTLTEPQFTHHEEEGHRYNGSVDTNKTITLKEPQLNHHGKEPIPRTGYLDDSNFTLIPTETREKCSSDDNNSYSLTSGEIDIVPNGEQIWSQFKFDNGVPSNYGDNGEGMTEAPNDDRCLPLIVTGSDGLEGSVSAVRGPDATFDTSDLTSTTDSFPASKVKDQTREPAKRRDAGFANNMPNVNKTFSNDNALEDTERKADVDLASHGKNITASSKELSNKCLSFKQTCFCPPSKHPNISKNINRWSLSQGHKYLFQGQHCSCQGHKGYTELNGTYCNSNGGISTCYPRRHSHKTPVICYTNDDKTRVVQKSKMRRSLQAGHTVSCHHELPEIYTTEASKADLRIRNSSKFPLDRPKPIEAAFIGPPNASGHANAMRCRSDAPSINDSMNLDKRSEANCEEFLLYSIEAVNRANSVRDDARPDDSLEVILNGISTLDDNWNIPPTVATRSNRMSSDDGNWNGGTACCDVTLCDQCLASDTRDTSFGSRTSGSECRLLDKILINTTVSCVTPSVTTSGNDRLSHTGTLKPPLNKIPAIAGDSCQIISSSNDSSNLSHTSVSERPILDETDDSGVRTNSTPTLSATVMSSPSSTNRPSEGRPSSELRPSIMLVLVTSCTLLAELVVTLALVLTFLNVAVYTRTSVVSNEFLATYIMTSNLLTIFTIPLNFLFFYGLSRQFRLTMKRKTRSLWNFVFRGKKLTNCC